ncbi:MAG TPA: hypothetical protein VH253_11705 [Phycisphaerae bacterium]|nr:hypothetical protein [Phycisphaerae bacterium]
MRRMLVVLAAVAMAAGCGAAARADSVVAPGGASGTEGAEGNAFPFDDGSIGGIPSQRYQQVYGATAFAGVGGPMVITDILFRPDATVPGAAFSTTIPSIQIDLSTTSRAPDTLSLTFADNVGADDAIVYSGALPLSSANTGPAGGPLDFDIMIHLTTPYTYDPAAGSLLLDVRNFGATTTERFDAFNVLGDSVSRVYSSVGGTVNDATAFSADSVGLATRFDYQPAGVATPLPPAAWGGALLLAMGAGWKASRRRAGEAAIRG